MVDNWEDWDYDNFVIPVLNVQTTEQLKRLEERKLVEESDNALSKDLFNNQEEEDLLLKELNELKQKEIIPKIITKEKEIEKNKNKISKQKDNELKQKELSIKIKQEKLEKIKHSELYGEAECDDEYDEYENKFYD
jgi:ubiquinone/menaquinone biosynthesis C-methylase UbiE